MLLLSGAGSNNVADVNTLVDNTAPKQETVREASKPDPSKAKANTTSSASMTEKQVRAYFGDIPELVEVARCESRFRHTDKDGNIIRGEENSQDVGVMQINERFHLEDSKELGYDIYSLRGNMAYARYLYEKEGIKPWKSSHPCWQKKVANIRQELALNK